MTSKELQLLQYHLSQSKFYLEYGCGNSTILACNTGNIEKIVSVESDAQYTKENLFPKREIKKAIDENRICFLFPNIGKTKTWGYPVNSSHKYLWPNYANIPYSINFKPDLVLVDGRFRVACALSVALYCEQSTQVLIHDYQRKNYHILENFFDIIKLEDNMVLFRLKSDLDIKKLHLLCRKYSYLPGDDASLKSYVKPKIKSIFGR